MNKQQTLLALLGILILGGLIVRAGNLVANVDREGTDVREMRLTSARRLSARAESPAGLAGPLAAYLGGLEEAGANPFAAFIAPLSVSPQIPANTEGVADLNPINRSGIRALVQVQKIGQTETISGFATGLDPYKAYISLFYDAGAPGSGPCACIPSNPPPAALQATCKTSNAPPINFSQMVIGYWLPLIGSSTRTLHVLKAGAADAPVPTAFAPIENIGAISIREDLQLGQPLPSAPDPNRFQLRACGRFRVDNN
ncbi:MAG: hypothetical protein SF339_24775 [Blastocatellia bacterium]|nr:hypothetical protein [Blastocatellia bacterium]